MKLNAFNNINIFLRMRTGLVLLICLGMPYLSYAADELQSFAPLHILTAHKDWVYSVSFRPDGQTLGSGGGDGTIRLWDAKTGTPFHTLTGHTWGVYSLCFSPDGQTLASGSFDCTVLLWKLAPVTPQ